MSNFYNDEYTSGFRLGDVIGGFTGVSPKFDSTLGSNGLFNFSIDFSHPEYFVVLTPCCSIKETTAMIVPLETLSGNFLASQYIRDDLLLTNRKMSKREAIGSFAFEMKYKSAEEKLDVDMMPKQYEFLEIFIYDDNNLLNEYSITKRIKEQNIELKTRCRMINFKKVMFVTWANFERNKECTKVLELSPYARHELRLKLENFYSRVPDEDKPFLPEI